MQPDPSRTALGAFDLSALRDLVWEERKPVLAFLGAVLLTALVGSMVATRWYEATAVLQLLPRAGREMTTTEVLKLDEGGYMEGRDRARTQIQIIQSRAVREEVLRRYAELWDDELKPDADGIRWLGSHMFAGPREDTQLVEIKVQHTVPDKAAALANLLADVYLQENLHFRRRAAKDARVWLDGQSEDYEARLEAASSALLEFRRANDLIGDSADSDDIATRITALHQAIGAVTTERVMAGGELAEHEAMRKSGRLDVLLGAFDDHSLSAMSQQRAQLRTQAAEIQGRYGEKHPESQRISAHLASVERLIEGEINRLIRAERSRFQALERKEQRLRDELESVKAELLRREELGDEYRRLIREEEAARKLVASLDDRGAEVDLQAQTQLSDARIVDRAVPPRSPVKPNVVLNLVMALIVGIAGGLAYALIRHQFRDALLTTRDVERRLELSVLGTVPTMDEKIPEEERALYPLRHPHSMQTECFRALRAMVMHHTNSAAGQVILVTSAVAGEGKTTTSIGLAVAFAGLGRRTLLVDGDLRRPRLGNVFGLEQAQGMSDTLVGRVDPLLLRRATSVKGLFVLPAGRPVDNAGELLAAPVARRMLDHLRTAFDVIIIDTSPVGVVADAMALSHAVDGVLMVVRRSHAPARLVVDAAQRLQRSDARIIGAVLNDTPPDKATERYSGGYYKSTAADRMAGR